MKICVTSEANALESKVELCSGRRGYFGLIDPGTMKFEALENSNLSEPG